MCFDFDVLSACFLYRFPLFCKRPSFGFQKAMFYTLKGHLSQCKRWPFTNLLVIRQIATR